MIDITFFLRKTIDACSSKYWVLSTFLRGNSQLPSFHDWTDCRPRSARYDVLPTWPNIAHCASRFTFRTQEADGSLTSCRRLTVGWLARRSRT